MVPDITTALDKLDLAIGRAAEFADPADLTAVAEKASAIRKRLGFLGRSVVVALVGGTGSGKSSILNALAGEPVAPTGVRRPTTERPLAWIPANPEPGLTRLLDDLGIVERVGHDSLGEIAVLDLPDTDSLVRSHRGMVERLLPRVDAVIWVVDPEKYNDRVLHRDFLQPLHRYARQFLFVLNQVDRLSPADEGRVVDDFRSSLAGDGITDAPVIGTAADPAEGPSVGISRLARDLRGRFEEKQVVIDKVLSDLDEARDELGAAAGVAAGGATSFDERWNAVAGDTVTALVDAMLESQRPSAERAGVHAARRVGGGPVAAGAARLKATRMSRAAGVVPPSDRVRPATGGHLTAAASTIVEFVGELSFETGGAFGRRLRAEFTPGEIEAGLGRSVEAATTEVGPFEVAPVPRWWKVAGILQWTLAVLLVVSVAWMWIDPASLESEWRLLSIAGGSAIIAVAIRALVIDGGRRAGSRSLDRYAASLRDLLRGKLDRRIGFEIRSRMRSRAEIAGALAELGLITAALQDQDGEQRI